jgi:hypothetical protein
MVLEAPTGCDDSALQSEVDIIYGNISRITERLVSVQKENRRLFYITTSGDAPEKIYEFEFDSELRMNCINHMEKNSLNGN